MGHNALNAELKNITVQIERMELSLFEGTDVDWIEIYTFSRKLRSATVDGIYNQLSEMLHRTKI